MTIRKNILIMSSRPEVLWTRVERSAYQKTIPVADVSTSLDMTLGGGEHCGYEFVLHQIHHCVYFGPFRSHSAV